MPTLPLPRGYTARPPSCDDAPAVAALIAACERADTGASRMTTEELLGDWRGLDLADEAVLVVSDDGSIVASADVLNRVYVNVSVYGFVHPEHRGRGLGRWLVEWGEAWTRDRMERAPAEARVVVQHFVNAVNEPARRLLEEMGYAAVRGTYTMTIELYGPPPAPVWPDGVRVRTFAPGQDERAAFAAREEAFADTWGRPPGTFEDFSAGIGGEGCDPTLWFLVEEGTELVGQVQCRSFGERGWISGMGVRRPWRRRGIALALLHHAFAELARRGVREVGLSVDAESLTGAPRLYLRAGMRVDQHYLLYQKELRPGVDLSSHAASM